MDCGPATEGASVGLFNRYKRRKSAGLRLHTGSGETRPPRILFVSHEATRTGAPKIILNILRHFREHTSATLQTILHSGGFLAEEFVQHSETDCLNLPREASDELAKRIRKLCTRYRDDLPQLAICNSMESRFIAFELYRLGIPVIFLVHELPSSYEPADYQQVYDCSHKIVFPVEMVRDAANSRLTLPVDKVHVLPQGLLDAGFGTRVSAEVARRDIRRELGLPEDAFVVLGCGTLDLRKGIDHFAGVARTLLTRKRVDRPVHFVWLGEGDRWTHSPYHYVMLDIEKSPAFGHVHFIGERPDVEPFFLGADAFFLSSRVDPFPCVIHEAMAAQLPIITFDRSGGAISAIADGAGLVAPYGDYENVCNLLETLASQPALFRSIRSKAVERVRARYCFDQYGDRLIQLAEEKLNGRISNRPATPPTVHPPTVHSWNRAA
jgi:glycosyltransferase involved in cell wall biosynthesis